MAVAFTSGVASDLLLIIFGLFDFVCALLIGVNPGLLDGFSIESLEAEIASGSAARLGRLFFVLFFIERAPPSSPLALAGCFCLIEFWLGESRPETI